MYCPATDLLPGGHPNASTARVAVTCGQWSASRTTGVATAKHTVTHLKHFNVSIMTSEVQSFVNKRNIWLAGKCYIATMLFDSCRAHTFKSSHMRLCVLFFRIVTNLIIFIVSFPKSSLSHPLDSQVYFILINKLFYFILFSHLLLWWMCGGNERFCDQ